MIQKPASNILTILQALFVTFLWSTSFVIIKLGLEEIPPLVFAGLRYFLLNESLTIEEITGLLLASLGIVLVNLKINKYKKEHYLTNK